VHTNIEKHSTINEIVSECVVYNLFGSYNPPQNKYTIKYYTEPKPELFLLFIQLYNLFDPINQWSLMDIFFCEKIHSSWYQLVKVYLRKKLTNCESIKRRLLYVLI